MHLAHLPGTSRRPLSVKAQKAYVEEMKLEWVERVRREWEGSYDEASVVFWTELPPETVRTILEILYERGELPEG